MSDFRPETMFSELALNMKPSPIRELMPMIKRAGMISFAGGNPDPRIFPIAEFNESSSVLKKNGEEILQYGATDGYEPLKTFIARWMTPRMGR